MVLPGAERRRCLDEAGETLQRVLSAAGLFDRGREVVVDALIEGRADQVGLGGKPPVQRAFTHPGASGDDVDGGVGSEFGVRLAGGAEDALGIARGIGA